MSLYSVSLSKLLNRQLFKQIVKNSQVRSNLITADKKSFSVAAIKLNTLRFTDKHEWINLNGTIGTVGITEYAQVFKFL